jgi:hypothetical protein
MLIPTSTSGQTGTNSTKRPSSPVTKASFLCPESYRTAWPSRQEETPIRMGPLASLSVI